MPTLTFQPEGIVVTAEPNTKVLAAAVRSKAKIRFGCASCRCGTCAVALSGEAQMSAMRPDETALLRRIGLTLDGSVRLACQARVLSGTAVIDLAFQNTYSPDEGEAGEDTDEPASST